MDDPLVAPSTPAPATAPPARAVPAPNAPETEAATENLRQALLALTYRCPVGLYAPECPFSKLAGVSHDSRRTLFAEMDRVSLLQLFELVPACTCPDDPRSRAPASPGPASP